MTLQMVETRCRRNKNRQPPSPCFWLLFAPDRSERRAVQHAASPSPSNLYSDKCDATTVIRHTLTDPLMAQCHSLSICQPLTLLMSCATPMTVFCPFTIGIHRMLFVAKPSSSSIVSWFIQVDTSPILRICKREVIRLYLHVSSRARSI